MTYYSYLKMNLLNGFIVAIVVFLIFFVASIGIFKVFTLNHIFDKGQKYLKDIDKYKKLDPETRSSIGFDNILFMFDNINNSFFAFSKKNDYESRLKLGILPKTYFILLSVITVVSLLKLTVNYTINSGIFTSINSDVRVAPVNQEVYKPSKNIFTYILKMIGQYIGISLILILPTIFVLIAFNSKKFIRMKSITKAIITLCVFIPVIIYGIINLFSTGFFENDYSSTDNNSKLFLKDFFNSKDYDFVDSIYNTKNSFIGNYGIWFIVFIIFFIFEFKHINNIEINKADFITKISIIGLVLFCYSIYVSLKDYGSNDESNKVFNDNFELNKEMYKYSVNNLKQAIVKYNYSCMPFGKD